MLSVPGRRTGRIRQIPLHVIPHGSYRYLVAIYGEQELVRNLRANNMNGRLSRGGHEDEVTLEAIPIKEAGDVLKGYLEAIPHVRPYLDIPEQPTDNLWIELASTHPVFRIQ